MIGICFLDYDREIALVAERTNPQSGQPELLGVGRIIKSQTAPEAEFAVLVTDRFQHQGLGTELLRRLIEVGHDEHLQRFTGDILTENLEMQRVCKALGFSLHYSPEDQLMKADRKRSSAVIPQLKIFDEKMRHVTRANQPAEE